MKFHHPRKSALKSALICSLSAIIFPIANPMQYCILNMLKII